MLSINIVTCRTEHMRQQVQQERTFCGMCNPGRRASYTNFEGVTPFGMLLCSYLARTLYDHSILQQPFVCLEQQLPVSLSMLRDCAGSKEFDACGENVYGTGICVNRGRYLQCTICAIKYEYARDYGNTIGNRNPNAPCCPGMLVEVLYDHSTH